MAPTACRRTVSGSLSLRCPRCFSPFPHGTRPLSVSQLCLALADGAAGFGQGSSDPALLRVPARLARSSRTGLSPAPARLPRRVPLTALLPPRRPYYPGRASTPPVWAGPLSLAATRGVTVVFLSSGYLDVSVHRVGLRCRGCRASRAAGCPIRVPADPWLLAPPRGLSRPAAPFVASGSHRHPPCALVRSLAAGHPCPRPSAPHVCPSLGAGGSRRPLARVCSQCSLRVSLRSQAGLPAGLLARFLAFLLSSLSHPVNEPSAATCAATVENEGLEPSTPGLQSRCSSQLSQSPSP